MFRYGSVGSRALNTLLVALVLLALFGVGTLQPDTAAAAPLASYTLDDGSYSYEFFGVAGSAIRGKAIWSNSDKVDCAGGAAIPGGGVIVATGVDVPGRRFMYWMYPPDTDSVMSISVPNATVQNAPPNGWGVTGQPQPVAACSLFRRLAPDTFRLTTMFVSSRGVGQGYALALLDTGVNLVVTPLP
jgi:hypothetical protein